MSQRTGERYRIEEQIGSGGMATIYRATDTVLQRPVALKLLNDQMDPALQTRLQAEAQAVAQLNHPNIVNVYDVGDLEGAPYIVMEYVQGTNLKRLIQEHGPLPLREAEDVVRQVGAALAYAHRNGIVHCDVKPHNILIAPDGRAKLVDFGIAQAQVDRKRRKDEQVYGTPLYIAPEQAAGQSVSPATDVYGLGLVLWEAATGAPPEKPDPTEPVRLPYAQVRLPRGLARVIQIATATEPTDRYSSIEDMMRDLASWRGAIDPAGQTTVVQSPTPRPVPYAGAAVAAAGAARVTPAPTRDARSAQPAAEPRRKRRRLPLLPLAALLLLLVGLGVVAGTNALRDTNFADIGGNIFGRNAGSAGSGNDDAVASGNVGTPHLVGKPLAQARTEAKERELTVRAEYDPNSDRPPGTVTEQTPVPGEPMERGGAIAVVVAGDEDTRIVGDGPTPTVRQVAGHRLVQMRALDQPVEVIIREDGERRVATLQPGEYAVAQAESVRVDGNPAAQLEINVDQGRYRGTLLEVANRFSKVPVAGPGAFVQFGPLSSSPPQPVQQSDAATTEEQAAPAPAQEAPPPAPDTDTTQPLETGDAAEEPQGDGEGDAGAEDRKPPKPEKGDKEKREAEKEEERLDNSGPGSESSGRRGGRDGEDEDD